MAHPWIDEENFEHGSASGGIWTSESDTGGKLDVASYRALAQSNHAGALAMPFRGAFCLRADLRTGDTNAHQLISTNVTQALDNSGYHRFMWYAGTDLAATANDIFNIFELASSGPVVEVAVSVQITAATDTIQFGVGGEGTPVQASAFGQVFDVGQWFAVEVLADIDDDAQDDGTIDLWVSPWPGPAENGVHVGQVTGLDQAAIAQLQLGTSNQAATTTGTMLWDEYVHDDARVYPISSRFPQARRLTSSGHVWVGPGCATVRVIDGGSGDGVATIYDTDRADTNDYSNAVHQAAEMTASEVDWDGEEFTVQRGCYVSLAGTNTQAIVRVKRAPRYSLAGLWNLGRRPPGALSS